MAPSSAHNNGFYVLMLVGIVVSTMVATCAASFYQDFDLTWGGDRAKILNGGHLLSLSLAKVSASGFKSKKEYLFGRIDMQLKLIAGNSDGIVTTYYVCSLIFTIIIYVCTLFSSLQYIIYATNKYFKHKT